MFTNFLENFNIFKFFYRLIKKILNNFADFLQNLLYLFIFFSDFKKYSNNKCVKFLRKFF